jgi:hypothetical protein
MANIKSYEQFVNENLFGQYSYYGAGSLFPIVQKLASEGKNPEQIYLFLTTIGVDEERKINVLKKVFLNESIDVSFLNEGGLYEEDDILKADTKDLAKGIDPSKAKPDAGVKQALDKLKDEESKDKSDTEKPEGEGSDETAKIEALKDALKDAQKMEKIKKILSESIGFNLEGIEDSILESVLEYHTVLEKLSQTEKDKLKSSDFIFPDRKSWPIHDEKHAKIALVWATWPQYKDLKNQVVASVLKRYPNLKGIGAAA